MRGDIGLEKLREISKARIYLLHNLARFNSVSSLQNWLTENWSNVENILSNDGKDRISHNMLLILAALSPGFRSTYFKGEKSLFMYRINHDLSLSQLTDSFQHLYEHLQSFENPNENILEVLYQILENDMLDHYFYEHRIGQQESNSQNCEVYIEVPFQLIPQLVANRSVIINKGLIKLSCNHHETLIKQVFIILLEEKLNSYIEKNPYVLQVFNNEIEDQRTKILFKCLQNHENMIRNSIYEKSPKSIKSGSLNMRNVEKESEKFPTCMKEIYKKLKKGEKLGHNQRFNFSLFLKDAGMSIDDASRFWRKYYSFIKGDKKSSSLWEERKHKYSYSVRHLYGQAGSRRNYKTASCSSLYSQNLCAFSGDIEDLPIPKTKNFLQNNQEPIPSISTQDNFSSQTNRGHLTCCARFENMQESHFSTPLQLFRLKKRGANTVEDL